MNRYLCTCASARRILLCLAVLFVVCGARVYAEPVRSYQWFWFFYEHEVTPRETFDVWRPFYLNRQYDHGRRSFSASLMPVVWWQYKSPVMVENHGLFNLFESTDYTKPDNTKDFDMGLFPLLLYGSSPTGSNENYLHVWPIGGVIKGKLAQRSITTVLFPGVALFFIFPPSGIIQTAAWAALSCIPVYAEAEFKNYYRGHAIFWPIIAWGSGPGRTDFRILPFYAHAYKKNYYDNYSFLLLFNYRKTIMKSHEEKTFLVVPFYGRRWNTNGRASSVTVLWPLFSWGYDKSRGDRELSFPWPLVQIQDCASPEIYKRIFFPFYGKYRFAKQETFFVTPLYFRLSHDAANFYSVSHVNAFIVWWFKRDYKKTPSPVYGKHWRYFKIWPLFHYEYTDTGYVSFNTLSLFPFRDEGGYEKLYQPLWSIVEYHKFTDGERRAGVLMRTYFQRWGNGFFAAKVPLLFSVETVDSKITRLNLLLSMFGYRHDKDGEFIKIFWIPLKVGDVPQGKQLVFRDETVFSERNAGGEYALASFDEHDRPLYENHGLYVKYPHVQSVTLMSVRL